MYPETSEFTKTGAVTRMTCIPVCPRFSSYVKFTYEKERPAADDMICCARNAYVKDRLRM